MPLVSTHVVLKHIGFVPGNNLSATKFHLWLRKRFGFRFPRGTEWVIRWWCHEGENVDKMSFVPELGWQIIFPRTENAPHRRIHTKKRMRQNGGDGGESHKPWIRRKNQLRLCSFTFHTSNNAFLRLFSLVFSNNRENQELNSSCDGHLLCFRAHASKTAASGSGIGEWDGERERQRERERERE